jgi:hypothetical protein
VIVNLEYFFFLSPYEQSRKATTIIKQLYNLHNIYSVRVCRFQAQEFILGELRYFVKSYVTKTNGSPSELMYFYLEMFPK